jgi:cytochrome c553
MTTKVKKTVIATLAVTALALSWRTVSPPPATGAAFQSTKSIYASKCASCHAMDGSGNTAKGKEMKLRDLRSAEVQKLTDEKMYEVIAKGASKGGKKMEGYEKSLGKEKVQQLVAYMRELAKK